MWHKHGVTKPRLPQSRPPLDAQRLDRLALRYVERFATSRAKLAAYLVRKLRERGWAGEREPDPAALAEKLAGLGYIDDAGYALAKARALGGRGFGAGRVRQALHAAGIGEEDGAGARQQAEDDKVEAALRLARRKRIGPYASERPDPMTREKQLGAMVRAGHGFALAKAVVAMAPGEEPDREALETLR